MGQMMERAVDLAESAKLGFYDHARQSYSDAVPHAMAGEFMVGDYSERTGHGVGDLGEFKILLHDFGRGKLSPQIQFFGDAVQAIEEMRRLCDGNLAVVLAEVVDAAQFSERLIGLGLRDVSD